MKNYNLLLVLFVFILLFSASCDKDNLNNNGNIDLTNDRHWFFGFSGAITGGEGYDLMKSSTDNNMYVCGAFLHVAENRDMKNLARFGMDNFVWEVVPGIDYYHNNFIRCVAEDNDGNLYFGGDFSTIAGIPAGKVARYNPSTDDWSSLRDIDFYSEPEQYGPNSGGVYAIEVIGNFVYIGGGIFNSDSTELRYLRRFNLSTNKWESIETYIDGRKKAMAKDNSGNLYIGGEFEKIGF